MVITYNTITMNGGLIMVLKILLISLAGLAVDVWFIKTEYAGKMAKATLLKGAASFFFVVLGIVCYAAQKTEFGLLWAAEMFPKQPKNRASV